MSNMIEAGVNPDSLAKQAKAQELIRFKQEIDGLKAKLESGQNKESELREACTNFEAVFMGKLWQEMQKTIPQEGNLHSNMEQMYVGMFDQPFSEHLAESGGIGLADMIYDQLAGKLKDASHNTLPGNAEIKPLAESGKAEVKSLAESFPQPTDLYPEQTGEAGEGGEAGEQDLNPVISTGQEVLPDTAQNTAQDKRVDQLSAAEIATRMNVLAREIAQAGGGGQDAVPVASVTVESAPLEPSTLKSSTLEPGDPALAGPGRAAFPSVAQAAGPTAADLADQVWERAELNAPPIIEEAAAHKAEQNLPGPDDFETAFVSTASDKPVIPEDAQASIAADAQAASNAQEEEWVSADSLHADI